MKHRETGYTQEAAAAKVGISIRSARRIERGERKPKQPREWRTRHDPLATVWESECVPLLQQEPTLTGLTLWEHLNEKFPEQFPASVLRTLQRRVKHWLATQGPSKEVIFRQSLPAAYQGLSDFTHPDFEITLAGQPFKHLLYQFRLAYSGWRYVQPVQGGESYAALANGLQNALQRAGGAPREHRTDSLSAAYHTTAQQQALTQCYQALCEHYHMRPTRNNVGVSHENGAVETAHGSLKHRVLQQLKLRGSHDFPGLAHYQQFLDKITDKLNRQTHSRFIEEQSQLQPLPTFRFMDFSEITVKVTRSSTITIKRVLYTVPARLIGEVVRVHLYHDHLQLFVGQTKVLQLPRVYPDAQKDRARCIDYRHIIHALAAKPQAFRFLSFQSDLLPNAQYHELWALAQQQFDPQQACKWMVGVLRMACDYDCEGALADELLNHRTLPALQTLQQRYLKSGDAVADIPLRQHSLADYDALLQGDWQQPQTEVSHV